MHSPNSKYLCQAPDIAALGTTFIWWVKVRTYHLADNERIRYVLSHDHALQLELMGGKQNKQIGK